MTENQLPTLDPFQVMKSRLEAVDAIARPEFKSLRRKPRSNTAKQVRFMAIRQIILQLDKDLKEFLGIRALADLTPEVMEAHRGTRFGGMNMLQYFTHMGKMAQQMLEKTKVAAD